MQPKQEPRATRLELVGGKFEESTPLAPDHKNRTAKSNPLLRTLYSVETRIARFKKEAREFYLQVMLSTHTCSKCNGRLEMIGRSLCVCRNCGTQLDPTLEFQRSFCCGARLVRRPAHYACSKCNRITPSWFLFDERVFDKDYFREMMQLSRERARRKKEAIRQMIAESRSENLILDQEPDLDAVPGLIEALNSFVGNTEIDMAEALKLHKGFDMNGYRRHILENLGWGARPFSAIPMLQQDKRLDRIFRFVTLIFMSQAGEVELDQDQGELLVQRIYHEAD